MIAHLLRMRCSVVFGDCDLTSLACHCAAKKRNPRKFVKLGATIPYAVAPGLSGIHSRFIRDHRRFTGACLTTILGVKRWREEQEE
jgi:hypothetical protein